MTNTDATLIGGGLALSGVVITLAGNTYRDRLKERRAGRQARDQAIAELLAAVVELVTGVQAIRAAYEGRTTARARIRIAAGMWAAVSAIFVGQEEFAWSALTDWRKTAPLMERLLAMDRDQNEQQRTMALDMAAVLLPRASRFYAAVAILTLGPDKRIADAVRDLTPAVGALTEAIAAKQRKYDRARSRAQKALGRFRTIADQRR